MNRPYNLLRPRSWRRGRRMVDGCAGLLVAALSIATVCALAYWQESARAQVEPLRVFEVRQVVAAEDPAAAARIACGEEYRDVVCEVRELDQ
jgi:hypothetical protein